MQGETAGASRELKRVTPGRRHASTRAWISRHVRQGHYRLGANDDLWRRDTGDMKHAIRRWVIPITLLIATIGGGTGAATAQDVRMQSLPIQALDCEKDPGELGPPETRREGELGEHGCQPAEGVAVTLHSARYDWHARCDTDAEGACKVEGPAGPDIVLSGAVHLSTVTPGHAPVEPVFETTIYTEFAGVSIVNLPVEGADPAAERQVLSVNAATCAEGAESHGACDRVPTDDTLLKVSETTGGPLADAPWLAPNAEGWVSFDVGALETEQLALLVNHPGDARFACTDLDSGDRIETIDGDPGAGDSFVIELTPISEGDIRCDVTLLDTIATPAG